MTRIIIAVLFISNAFCSFGQKAIGIKLYQNTDIFEIRYFESMIKHVEKLDKVNFTRVSLAVDIDTKEGYTHEIEFMIPEVSKSYDKIRHAMNHEFQKETPDFEGQASSYSLRYELSKTLTNKANKLDFNLGVGLNPYYVLVEYIPNVDTRYYSSTKLYGFVMNLIPRVIYKLSDRFSVDLNVPLKIYDLRAEKRTIKNPAIPIHQRTTINYSNIFFESAYTIRLGLMCKLRK
jgi:hypothetical protein